MEEPSEQREARAELKTALVVLHELARRRRPWVGLPLEIRHELEQWAAWGEAVREYLNAEDAKKCAE